MDVPTVMSMLSGDIRSSMNIDNRINNGDREVLWLMMSMRLVMYRASPSSAVAPAPPGSDLAAQAASSAPSRVRMRRSSTRRRKELSPEQLERRETAGSDEAAVLKALAWPEYLRFSVALGADGRVPAQPFGPAAAGRIRRWLDGSAVAEATKVLVHRELGDGAAHPSPADWAAARSAFMAALRLVDVPAGAGFEGMYLPSGAVWVASGELLGDPETDALASTRAAVIAVHEWAHFARRRFACGTEGTMPLSEDAFEAALTDAGDILERLLHGGRICTASQRVMEALAPWDGSGRWPLAGAEWHSVTFSDVRSSQPLAIPSAALRGMGMDTPPGVPVIG